MLSFNILLAVLIGHVAWAANVAVTWDVSYVQVNRDGYNNRRAIGVNGALPIPPVYVDHGDTLHLTVNNHLDEPTTIHSHGIFHNGSAYMDGASMITQCGIPPGESFTYHIYAEQTGTYWLHAHHKAQQADGLRAPFIIRDTKCPYEYDEEVLISLEDWYPTESGTKMAEVTAPGSTGPPPPTFPYGLINGYNGNNSMPIRFVPGKRYRIRVLSMSTTEWWKFSIPGHKLEVIEADGIMSEPHIVDGLDLAPAQRYSAIVTALDTDEFNYIYNCTLYADFVPWTPGMNPRVYTGLVEYNAHAPTKEYALSDDRQLAWATDIGMHALDGYPMPPADRHIDLTSRLYITDDLRNLRTLDTLPYIEPQVPTLFTAMTTGSLAMDPRVYGPQAQAFVIPHMQNVEITIKNIEGLPHAMHLHHHAFYIAERGPVDPAEIEIAPGTNFTPADLPRTTRRRSTGVPMRRDTITVPAFEYVKLRIRGDLPSTAFLHCHTLSHNVAGLAATLVIAPDVLQRTQRIPEDLIHMCLRQGIRVEGNAVGNHGLDFTGLPPVPILGPTPAVN
ncbi:ferroxidase fet3 [Coemansia sp. RSA 2611]|nr:ferroxidase fet3 [Coemansia sp. RSA 2708]KAJ2316429.1 ferroxidase fet3 [Coemansia sp. RSA 2704]KAJ2329185.1 ferroxidase fet3 [Coemansia sp. RSA 2702]KAJ2363924.1 ferroxidase fet3 [Coemansia sp. RSA 2610]KAJ2384445.1 ferroxidase fet3 [Coemansia sp. RSA 2611]KAJ2728741.1 ferroxidase fet3 [Coemansia sp. Cherry 401B]